MDSAPDWLERPPGAVRRVGAENRAARGKETGGAKNGSRAIRFRGAQNRRAGQPRGFDPARAGGPARCRTLEAAGTGSVATRLRAMPSRADVPRAFGCDRHGVAL